MTDSEILQALTLLFRDVFDDDDIIVNHETVADDIDGWDSQAHVNLIVAAEVRFGIRFRTSEIESLHNVGQFVQLIASRLQSATP